MAYCRHHPKFESCLSAGAKDKPRLAKLRLSRRRSMAGAIITNNAFNSERGTGSLSLSRRTPLSHHSPSLLPAPRSHNPRSALELGARAPESWQYKILSSDGDGGFTTFACPPTPGCLPFAGSRHPNPGLEFFVGPFPLAAGCLTHLAVTSSSGNLRKW